MVGSEDALQNFFKVHIYLFKRGQVEHILTMANLELNPSPFMPHPNIHCIQWRGTSSLVDEGF